MCSTAHSFLSANILRIYEVIHALMNINLKELLKCHFTCRITKQSTLECCVITNERAERGVVVVVGRKKKKRRRRRRRVVFVEGIERG